MFFFVDDHRINKSTMKQGLDVSLNRYVDVNFDFLILFIKSSGNKKLWENDRTNFGNAVKYRFRSPKSALIQNLNIHIVVLIIYRVQKMYSKRFRII